jgi:hypothetical protein
VAIRIEADLLVADIELDVVRIVIGRFHAQERAEHAFRAGEIADWIDDRFDA